MNDEYDVHEMPDGTGLLTKFGKLFSDDELAMGGVGMGGIDAGAACTGECDVLATGGAGIPASVEVYGWLRGCGGEGGMAGAGRGGMATGDAPRADAVRVRAATAAELRPRWS